jgi:hypothetical protein
VVVEYVCQWRELNWELSQDGADQKRREFNKTRQNLDRPAMKRRIANASQKQPVIAFSDVKIPVPVGVYWKLVHSRKKSQAQAAAHLP